MKKQATLFLIMVCLSMVCIAQTSYPKGAYMSLVELQAKRPSKDFDLEVVKRTTGEIRMNGGNDYKLFSADRSIKKKVLKKSIWAFSDGENLYINCFLHKCQLWYALVEAEDENRLTFNGGVSNGEAVGAAVAGGAIGGAAIATKRYQYTLNLLTGELEQGGKVKRDKG